jgi:hypothetical protein
MRPSDTRSSNSSSIANMALLTASNSGCRLCVAFEGLGSFRTRFSMLGVSAGNGPVSPTDRPLISQAAIAASLSLRHSERVC